MTNEPALDPQAIENLKAISPDDGGEFLRELVAIFLSDTPKCFADLDAAVASGDAVSGTRAAHSVKGSASNFGAARLANAAKQIESLCRDGKMATTADLIVSMKAEFAAVELQLRAITEAS